MLKLIKKLSDEDAIKLMEVYHESNLQNIKHFNIKCNSQEEGLKIVEKIHIDFAKDFLKNNNNFLFVWEENNQWLSAVRFLKIEDFYYLEALETNPKFRKQGYAEKLLNSITKKLSKEGNLTIKDFVSKNNIASKKTHEKCGFKIVSDVGIDYSDNNQVYKNSYQMVFEK